MVVLDGGQDSGNSVGKVERWVVERWRGGWWKGGEVGGGGERWK